MTRNLLAQKAVLASLNISGWSPRRLDKRVTREVAHRHGAAENAGRYNKLLFAKEATEKLTQLASSARHTFYEMSQPWLDNGARVLPSALYVPFSQKMRTFEQDYTGAVEAFCREYPDHILEAKRRLNGLFNPADYPPQQEVRRQFAFKVTIMPCPDAADFRVDLAQEHADDIRADIEERMREALLNTMRNSADRIVEVVGHMAERLKGYRPGQREGHFRDSLVDNIRELVDLLPAFNMTNDPTLAAITARMQSELCSHDAQELRDKPRVRKAVAQAAESILVDVADFMA
jgi:hypothetical protein